ncbi:outer membrane protein assembly factor BamB family protein [Phytohabitans sp. LJ34]|uniref:outer membrane protein assembly factor BamB family protein n=1 Tax=Phytohabitans sp. LJ34 TaxID=3452217 RepID=UPI003F8951EE
MRQPTLLAATAAVLMAGCSTATPAVPTPPDVTDYRGDLSRTGRMPGPGPRAPVHQRWRHTGPAPVTFPPAVAAGHVLAPGDRSLVALDLATGAPLWSVALGAALNAPLTVAAPTVYATTADGVTHAIDLDQRRERWRLAGVVDGAQVSVHAGVLYAGTRTRDLAAHDPTDGRRRWSVHIGHNVSRIAISDTIAYVGGEGGGRLTAVDLRTRRVIWAYDTGGDRIVTPAVDAGTIYVAGVAAAALPGRRTRLHALDARTGNRKWVFAPPGDPPMSSFAVGGRAVFIGTDTAPGLLYAVARDTGALRWQRPVPGPVDRPALTGDTVYVASGAGGLLALDANTGQRRWACDVDGYAEGVVLTGGLALVASRDAQDAAGAVTAFAGGGPNAAGTQLPSPDRPSKEKS